MSLLDKVDKYYDVGQKIGQGSSAKVITRFDQPPFYPYKKFLFNNYTRCLLSVVGVHMQTPNHRQDMRHEGTALIQTEIQT